MTADSPVSAGRFSRQRDIKTIRALLPYLWPRGATELRLRVVIALTFLAVAKLINVCVPFFYKWAVDALSGEAAAAVVLPGRDSVSRNIKNDIRGIRRITNERHHA